MYPIFDKVINDDPQPTGSTSANTCINAGGADVHPVRIQRSKISKQVSPNGLPIVYVGRPGKFGNPFKIKCNAGIWIVNYPLSDKKVMCTSKDSAIDVAVKLYEFYIKAKMERGFDLSELKGKNLSCWCSLKGKCHADVLLELANRKE